MRHRRAQLRAIIAISASAVLTSGGASAALADPAGPAPAATGWRLVKTFPQGAAFIDFGQVLSMSRTAAWAVGQEFGGGMPTHAVTAYWNGRSWSAVRLPRGELGNVGVIAGSSPSSVWAFGAGRGGNYLLRWVNSGWSVWRAAGAANLFVLTAAVRGPQDVWIFGYKRGKNGFADVGAHFNGRTWTDIPMPLAGGKQQIQPAGATTAAANDVWVTTNQYPGTSQILHWHGRWHVASLPQHVARMRFLELSGIVALSGRDIWAAGWRDSVHDPGEFTPIILHLDARRWHWLPVGPCFGCQTAFIAPDGAGGAWAQTNQSFVLHDIGGVWHKVPVPGGLVNLANVPGTRSMWGVAGNKIFAYGTAGV